MYLHPCTWETPGEVCIVSKYAGTIENSKYVQTVGIKFQGVISPRWSL